MHPPEDIDALLRHLHDPPAKKAEDVSNLPPRYSPEDEALLARMINDAAVERNATGIFMVRHDDGRLEYMIVRGDRLEASDVAAQFIQRQMEITAKDRRGN